MCARNGVDSIWQSDRLIGGEANLECMSVMAMLAGATRRLKFGMAALSGSSLANTAMLGSALLPDMFKRGYEPTVAMVPIMATGGIAMLIPPSALAVLLGSLAGISISKLLIAGMVPVLMLAVLFIGHFVVACVIDPSRAPRDDGPVVTGWARYRPFMVDVVPLSLVFVAVIGSLVAGIATPTEWAALGCVASVVAGSAIARCAGAISSSRCARRRASA
jgi:TRAP-type C4-dicarboxylate transport system permease large subunit